MIIETVLHMLKKLEERFNCTNISRDVKNIKKTQFEFLEMKRTFVSEIKKLYLMELW